MLSCEVKQKILYCKIENMIKQGISESTYVLIGPNNNFLTKISNNYDKLKVCY